MKEFNIPTEEETLYSSQTDKFFNSIVNSIRDNMIKSLEDLQEEQVEKK